MALGLLARETPEIFFSRILRSEALVSSSYFFQNSPLGTATKSGGFPTFVTTLNSFIDIIHSTENKAIKEGTTSVNSH